MTGLAPAAIGPAPAVVDGVDIDTVAAAVRGCPAVDDLSAGGWGGVVSYLPGRQVPGVRVAGDHLVISVRGRWGVPAGELARQIRAAVAVLAGPRRIDVVVADVADDPAAAGDAAAEEVSQWLTSPPAGLPGAPSSGPAIQTGAAIPPRSSRA